MLILFNVFKKRLSGRGNLFSSLPFHLAHAFVPVLVSCYRKFVLQIFYVKFLMSANSWSFYVEHCPVRLGQKP